MSSQKIILSEASILVLAVSCNGFRISMGDSCPPKPATMNPFDVYKFLGDWYQVNGLPAFFQPEGTHCIRATYGEMDYGRFSVRNVEVTTNGYWSEICGYTEVPNPSYPAEFLVHFPTPPAGDLWILVRDPKNVAFEAISRALDAFKKQNLSTDGFLPMAHENCGDYENPAGGKPCIPGDRAP